MFKACSRCGRIHDSNYKCSHNKPIVNPTEEHALRSRTAWTKKSLEVREKAKFLCEVCKDGGVFTYDGLEVHHITKIRDNKELLLDNYNCVCLCQFHHEQAERGLIDREYLLELARKREDDLS